MTSWLSDESDDNPPPYKFINAMPPRNIILFGETGAGKSAVVNLIAGAEVASISADMKACTLQATKHNLTLPGAPAMSINIWDTIGLEEPDGDLLKGIENAHKLIQELHTAGGVDLLLFCIRAGRITVAMQRHYRLFSEILCAKRVALAIVVTHLENEKVMEDWWVRNRQVFATYGMCSVAHACITAAPVHLRQHAAKRAESRTTLQRVLREALSGPHPRYVRDAKSWFVSVMEMVWAFLTRGGTRSSKKTLAKRLETRCAFTRGDAWRLAEMILSPNNR